MLSYHVEIESTAAQALVRMARGDKAAAQPITAAIRSLSDEPRPARSTKLVGADARRIRVGDYRVI